MKKSEITRSRLLSAIDRIVGGCPQVVEASRPISVSAVADEAGLHPATIHTRYPDVANKIRELSGLTRLKESSAARHQDRVMDLEKELSHKKMELIDLDRKFKSVVSQNASLLLRVRALEMQLKTEKIGFLK